MLLLKTEYKIKYNVDFWPEYKIKNVSIDDVYYVLHKELRTYSYEWEMTVSKYKHTILDIYNHTI